MHSAGRAQARQARHAAPRGSANEGNCARRHGSPPSKAIPRCQQGPRDGPRIPWAMRRPDRRTTVIFRGPGRLFAKDGQPSNSRSKRSGEPLLLPPRRPPGRVHDHGRCPLYVRAQLETAGLPWTQRDLTAPKATAREAGNTQLTGRFRRWWQVMGSNHRRLSRRFTDRLS